MYPAIYTTVDSPIRGKSKIPKYPIYSLLFVPRTVLITLPQVYEELSLKVFFNMKIPHGLSHKKRENRDFSLSPYGDLS
jgi:hypothetical protein